MSDIVKGFVGTSVGADNARLTWRPAMTPGASSRWNFGATARIGLDVGFSRDETRGLFIAELDGFLSAGPGGASLAVAPMIGLGVEGPSLYWRLTGGPLISRSFGVAGQTSLGVMLGDNVALDFGLGVGYLPKVGELMQTYTDYDCTVEGYDYSCEEVTHTTTSSASAVILRPQLGLLIFFGR